MRLKTYRQYYLYLYLWCLCICQMSKCSQSWCQWCHGASWRSFFLRHHTTSTDSHWHRLCPVRLNHWWTWPARYVHHSGLSCRRVSHRFSCACQIFWFCSTRRPQCICRCCWLKYYLILRWDNLPTSEQLRLPFRPRCIGWSPSRQTKRCCCWSCCIWLSVSSTHLRPCVFFRFC